MGYKLSYTMETLEKVLESEKSTITSVLKECTKFDLYIKEKRISKPQTNVIKEKIKTLIEGNTNNECKLLLRGENKSNLKRKLGVGQPYYDLLFLIGDKAKNFLRSEIRPKTTSKIKDINDYSRDVINWIWDKYEKSSKISDSYFKNEPNKLQFLKFLSQDYSFVHYYQYFLHNISSNDYQVNFVSTTENSEVALDKKENDKIVLIIVLFATCYSPFAMQASGNESFNRVYFIKKLIKQLYMDTKGLFQPIL